MVLVFTLIFSLHSNAKEKFIAKVDQTNTTGGYTTVSYNGHLDENGDLVHTITCVGTASTLCRWPGNLVNTNDCTGLALDNETWEGVIDYVKNQVSQSIPTGFYTVAGVEVHWTIDQDDKIEITFECN